MTSFNIIHSTTNFPEWPSERQSQRRQNPFKKANSQWSAELGGREQWMTNYVDNPQKRLHQQVYFSKLWRKKVPTSDEITGQHKSARKSCNLTELWSITNTYKKWLWLSEALKPYCPLLLLPCPLLLSLQKWK